MLEIILSDLLSILPIIPLFIFSFIVGLGPIYFTIKYNSYSWLWLWTIIPLIIWLRNVYERVYYV